MRLLIVLRQLKDINMFKDKWKIYQNIAYRDLLIALAMDFIKQAHSLS